MKCVRDDSRMSLNGLHSGTGVLATVLGLGQRLRAMPDPVFLLLLFSSYQMAANSSTPLQMERRKVYGLPQKSIISLLDQLVLQISSIHHGNH